MLIVVVGTYIDNDLITAGNITTEFSTMGAIDILFLVISSSIVAPIIEEIIFRGILLNALGRVMSVKGAVLVSSVVFGLLHRTSVATVVTATVLGVVLACIYLANRNLVNSMAVHGLYNFLALFLSYKAQVIDPWLNEVMGFGVSLVVVVLGGIVVYVAVCLIAYEKLKQHKENFKPKHNKDAKYGWYKYESRFALPVLDENEEIERYNVFHVAIIVRHSQDGKLYLYDIMNIKKETSTLFQC